MSPDTEELGFEEALAKLEQIVAELEAGELPLAEALAKFGEGMELKKFCEQKLAAAEAQIEQYMEAEARPESEDEGKLLQ